MGSGQGKFAATCALRSVSIRLARFVKLVLVNRKARLGRNPKTGETIQIPAKTVVKFRVAKAAKEAIIPKKPVPPVM